MDFWKRYGIILLESFHCLKCYLQTIKPRYSLSVVNSLLLASNYTNFSLQLSCSVIQSRNRCWLTDILLFYWDIWVDWTCAQTIYHCRLSSLHVDYLLYRFKGESNEHRWHLTWFVVFSWHCTLPLALLYSFVHSVCKILSIISTCFFSTFVPSIFTKSKG